jgi:hypothetical protein
MACSRCCWKLRVQTVRNRLSGRIRSRPWVQGVGGPLCHGGDARHKVYATAQSGIYIATVRGSAEANSVLDVAILFLLQSPGRSDAVLADDGV